MLIPLPSYQNLLIMEFRIIESAGSGGEGDVFKAELMEHGQNRFCSAKRLRRDSVDVSQIETWIKSFSSLNSDQVQKPFRLIEQDSDIYILSNWIDGETLQSWLGKSPPPEKLIHILARISSAIKSMHSDHPTSFLHLDINPRNIIIYNNEAYLIDLGISRSIQKSKDYTQTEFFRGTLAYSAPEIVSHNHLSTAADIYSLGIVFFEAFSGQQIFRDPSQSKQIDLILRSEVSDLGSIIQDFPQSVSDLVRDMLNKDPKKRPKIERVFEVLKSNQTKFKDIKTDSQNTLVIYRKNKQVNRYVVFAITCLVLAGVTLGLFLSRKSSDLPRISIRKADGSKVQATFVGIESAILDPKSFRSDHCKMACNIDYYRYQNAVDKDFHSNVVSTVGTKDFHSILKYFRQNWKETENGQKKLQMMCSQVSQCLQFRDLTESIRNTVDELLTSGKNQGRIKKELFTFGSKLRPPTNIDGDPETSSLFENKRKNKLLKIKALGGYDVLAIDSSLDSSSPTTCATYAEVAFTDHYLFDKSFWRLKKKVTKIVVIPSGYELIQTTKDLFEIQEVAPQESETKQPPPLICFYNRDLSDGTVSLYTSEWTK